MSNLQPPISHPIPVCRVLSILESVCSKVSVWVWLEEHSKCTNSHQCPDATKLGSWSKDCRRPQEREFGSRNSSLHCNRMIREFTAVQRQGLLPQLCHWFTVRPGSATFPQKPQSPCIKQMDWVISLKICPGPTLNACYSATALFLFATIYLSVVSWLALPPGMQLSRRKRPRLFVLHRHTAGTQHRQNKEENPSASIPTRRMA